MVFCLWSSVYGISLEGLRYIEDFFKVLGVWKTCARSSSIYRRPFRSFLQREALPVVLYTRNTFQQTSGGLLYYETFWKVLGVQKTYGKFSLCRGPLYGLLFIKDLLKVFGVFKDFPKAFCLQKAFLKDFSFQKTSAGLFCLQKTSGSLFEDLLAIENVWKVFCL